MKYGYHDTKEKIQIRLNRAEGQVRGIAKMVDQDKYCIDILTQIGAAQAALDKVAIDLLREHTRHCLMESGPRDKDKKTEELIDAVNRLITT